MIRLACLNLLNQMLTTVDPRNIIVVVRLILLVKSRQEEAAFGTQRTAGLEVGGYICPYHQQGCSKWGLLGFCLKSI